MDQEGRARDLGVHDFSHSAIILSTMADELYIDMISRFCGDNAA